MAARQRAFIAWQKGNISKAEMYRYQELNKKLMGNDAFVEIDNTNPEWKEFNQLTAKIL